MPTESDLFISQKIGATQAHLRQTIAELVEARLDADAIVAYSMALKFIQDLDEKLKERKSAEDALASIKKKFFDRY